MQKISVKMLTRAAILLAIVIVVQLLGRFIPSGVSNFIVGPLVNACLLVATVASGIWGGIVISIIAPFTSLINNHAPIASALLPFAPFVAIGNILFVLGFYMFYKTNTYLAAALGSVVKFAFLWGAIILFLEMTNFGAFENILVPLFSWPQLITAVIGSAVAIIIIKLLGKTIEPTESK